MARHGHDDISQTQAEQWHSANSVMAQVSTAVGLLKVSCSSITKAFSKPAWGGWWRLDWHSGGSGGGAGECGRSRLLQPWQYASSLSVWNRTEHQGHARRRTDWSYYPYRQSVSGPATTACWWLLSIWFILPQSCRHLAATVVSCTTVSHLRCSHSAVVGVSNMETRVWMILSMTVIPLAKNSIEYCRKTVVIL